MNVWCECVGLEAQDRLYVFVLQCVAACCSVLQCVLQCVLQRVLQRVSLEAQD